MQISNVTVKIFIKKKLEERNYLKQKGTGGRKATSISCCRSVQYVPVMQSDGGACYNSLVLQLVSNHFHAYHKHYSTLEDDAF